VWNLIGFAMETTIVEIILMRTIFIAVPDLARQIHLDVLTIGAYRPHGFAMAIQIVMEVKTSQKISARPKVELVLAIYSHVTTATVFQEFMFVTGTMIVWIILTKMKTGNVRPANAILTLSSLVKPIANGAELFALKKIGFAMVIQTVLMVLMRIKLKFLIAMSQWRNAHRISSNVETVGVSTNSGNVIMTMIVVTALMKAKTAKMPIENAMKQLNSLVQTPNVFP
jgi:uncharacterized membrane protein (DUF485 family)